MGDTLDDGATLSSPVPSDPAAPLPDAVKVLHVSQPTEAGVANVLLALVSDQVERGWDVHVACPHSDGYLASLATEAGATVHDWEASRSPGSSVAAEVRAMNAIIRSIRPGVVHLHSSKAGLVGRLAIRGSIPTIFEPHAWSFEAVSGLIGRASLAWERLASRWTDLTLCVSQAEADTGAAFGCLARQSTVINNGVDVARWAPRDRLAARRRLQINPHRPVAVLVGRLAPQKGQDIAAAAWPIVRHRLSTAELYLVGDGPDREALEHAAVDGVTLVGRADPRDWYAAADVILLPSRWEGMPLVVLEAMASGRSIVCSDVTGIRDSIGDSAQVIQPGEPVQLAHAVARRLADPELSQLEGEANRQRACDVFDLRTSCREVALITEGIVAARRRRRSRSA